MSGESSRLDRRGSALVALGFVAAGVLGALLIGGEDDGGEPRSPSAQASVEQMTPDRLARIAARGGDVFWAGARPGTRLELERTPAGLVFVRYQPVSGRLPPGEVLTIGTYPFADAFRRLRRQSAGEGWTARSLPGGDLVAINSSRPTSAYLALPRLDLQVEVYSPVPRTTRSVALSGDVVPVRSAQERGP